MLNKVKQTLTGLLLATIPYIISAQEHNFIDVEVITPEGAQEKYGENIPPNVYTSLDDFVSAANGSVGNLRANVQPGVYNSTNGYIITKPVSIKGVSAQNTIIDAVIYGVDYMEIENVKSNGNSEIVSGNDNEAFAAFLKGGKLTNCDLYSRALIGVDPSYNFIMINNTFHNIQSVSGDVAVTFTSLFPTTQRGNIIVSSNDFYNINKIFFLNNGIEAGVKIVGGGNNYFENCPLVVYNPYGYDVDINLSGNAWADNSLARISQPVLITDEQYILDNKIISPGTGTIDVSNPLNYNPMEFRDRDWDGYTDYEERIAGSDEFDINSTPQTAMPISTPLNLVFIAGALGTIGYLISRSKKIDL